MTRALVITLLPSLAWAQPVEGGSVRLTLRSTRPGATLYTTAGERVVMRGTGLTTRVAEIDDRSEPVCTAPCEAVVGGRETFVVRGPGLVSSENFELPQPATQVDIEVRPTPRSLRWAGIGTFAAGLVFASIGIGLFAQSVSLDERYRKHPLTLPTNFDPSVIPPYRNSGIALMTVGAVVTVAGIVWLIATRTRVSIRAN